MHVPADHIANTVQVHGAQFHLLLKRVQTVGLRNELFPEVFIISRQVVP